MGRKIGWIFLMVLIVGSFVFFMAQKKHQQLKEQTTESPLPEYIGVAKMKEDRTIVLFLRANTPSGGVCEVRAEYPPKHPQYASILAHIGDLKPCQIKSVKPWPE